MGVLDLFSLEGRSAVVTAASRGIGRGIALCLAEAGADVIVSSRTLASAEAVVSEIRALGRRAYAVAADATRPEDMDALAAATEDRLSGFDIWVNNAGGQPDNRQRPVLDVWPENFDAQLDLNLKSAWAGAVAAARRMRDGGSIINISSRAAAPGPRVGHGLYGAAKAAVNSLTMTLAAELAPRIRVNAVGPSAVLTETFCETMGVTSETAAAALPQLAIPMARYGTPTDIGAAVVYLASPAASWITGQCLYVTGGKFP